MGDEYPDDVSAFDSLTLLCVLFCAGKVDLLSAEQKQIVIVDGLFPVSRNWLCS